MSKDRYEDQELDNRYHLQRLLDAGSFGAVYEARDLKLGRIVAVKILFEQDETAFRKEAKLAVQFEHPNVVKVFDYGSDKKLNVGYIVMEFLNGRRLDQLITSQSGRVSYPMIAQFADEIGSALQLAHDRQLIHRDLKPRNVMLVDDGTSQERFVLLDLGLASQTNSTSTLRNQTLDGALSPHYASPEQFGQGSVDFRSDVYSFGTILFELVTGQIPFPRDQLLGLMMAICNEQSPRMSDIAPDRDVPDELEEIIQHCLQKAPADRPGSMRIVRETILKALLPTYSSASPHTMNFARGDTDPNEMPIGNIYTAGTGTLLPPGPGGSERGLSQRPSWKESSRRNALPPQPEWKPDRSSRNSIVFGLLLLPVLLFVVWQYLIPDNAPVEEVPVQTQQPWKLPEGFAPLPASPIIQATVDGRAYYQQIERVVGEGLSVGFVLIDPPRIAGGSRVAAPYYIMENKVWNRLYAVYAEQSAHLTSEDDLKDDWKLGAMAGGRDLGVQDHPELPVFRVTAGQAHRFAVWLSGIHGHLPSIDQWTLATGLHHRQTRSNEMQDVYPEGPYKGVWEGGSADVAVNRRSEGPRPVGSALDDVTITGVRDMAGNGQELTETLINGGRVGDASTREESRSLLSVLVRGRSYISHQPLTWEDIGESAEVPDAIGYTESDPTIGFRVVLETAD